MRLSAGTLTSEANRKTDLISPDERSWVFILKQLKIAISHCWGLFSTNPQIKDNPRLTEMPIPWHGPLPADNAGTKEQSMGDRVWSEGPRALAPATNRLPP